MDSQYICKKNSPTHRSKLLQGPQKITPSSRQAPLHILIPNDPLAHLEPERVDLTMRRRIHVVSLEIRAGRHVEKKAGERKGI